ncbi:MAG: hypothetical protein WBP08_15960 [Saprospiraceae bacterium]
MKYLLMILSFLFILGCSDKKVKIYNDQGSLSEEYTVNKNKEKNGTYQSFFPSGKLKEISQYKSGVLYGKRTLYFESGQKEIEELYSETGLLQGPYFAYFPSGKIKVKKYYSANVLSGELKLFYPDGKVKEEVSMYANMENGPFSEYYQNGAIHWKGNYRNGDNEYGILYEYDSLGAPIKIMKCDTLTICRTIWKPGMPEINVDTVRYE